MDTLNMLASDNSKTQWVLVLLGIVIASLWAPVAIAVAATVNFLTSNNAWADVVVQLLRDPVFLVFGILIVPVVEEFLFRKLWLGSLLREDGTSAFRKITIVAAVFAALHWYPSLVIPAFAGGIFLGYLYHWSKSVVPSIAAHSAYNAAYTLVLLAIPGVSDALVKGQPASLPFEFLAVCLVCCAVVLRVAVKYSAGKSSAATVKPAENT